MTVTKKAKGRTGRAAASGRGAASPAAVPASDPERDYLVIFEEADTDGLPTDDTLVLDIESPAQKQRGEMDVQQKLDIGLTNTTSRLGTAGFVVTILGTALAAVLMVWFAMVYPGQWYDSKGAVNTGLVRSVALLAVIAVLMLVVGTIMTHYGRRIKARGELRDVRIVEKESQSQMSFE